MKLQWILAGVIFCCLAAYLGYVIARPHPDGAPVSARQDAPPVPPPATVAAKPTPASRSIGPDGLATLDLHVKDATLAEVADALASQMDGAVIYNGLPLRTVTPADGTYTCNLSGRTFWEVIGTLDDQRLINVHDKTGTISLDENATSTGAHAISGPFFFQVFERPITQSRPPSLGLQFAFLADPRLKVVSLSYSLNASTTRKGIQVGRSGQVSPFINLTRTGEVAGASASSLLQHGWETAVSDVVTNVDASATFKLQSGEQQSAVFHCSVKQPPH